MVVAVHLSTLFIDNVINVILLSWRTVVPLSSPNVPILMIHETEFVKTEEQQDDIVDNIMAERASIKNWYKLHVL